MIEAAFWLVIIVAAVLPMRFSLYGVFATAPFMATSVLPPALMGGSSLAANNVMAVVFLTKTAMRAVSNRNFQLFNINSANRIYIIYWLYAAFVTASVPRLAGDILVYPVRAADYFLINLVPSSSNITQMVYLTTSMILTIVTTNFLAGTAKFSYHSAIRLGAIVVIVTGFFDFTDAVGLTPDVMTIFRNSSYAILANQQIAGTTRVIGAMPEASAYGTLTATFFAMLFFSKDFNIKSTIDTALALFLNVFVVLSLSTAGIAMLAFIYVWFVGVNIAHFRSLLFHGKARRWSFVIALIVVALILIFSNDWIYEKVGSVFSRIFIEKTASQSFGERSRWNEQAITAFFDSNFVGVGIGSVRSSSYLINVVASCGLAGSLLYLLYLYRLVFSRRRFPATSAVGARLAFIPILMGASLYLGTPDLGVLAAVVAGLASSDIGGSRENVRSIRLSRKGDRSQAYR